MRKILAFLLALATALSLLVPALAASADTEPEGCGTAAEPYRIGTAEELAAFRDMVNGGRTELCAVLVGDIILDKSVEWTPIGESSACAYGGVFRGNGYTVSGLRMHAARDSAGFFGCLSAKADVTGLTISDSTIAGRRFAGAVAGYSGGTISDCHTEATVQVKGSGAAGGIVGSLSSEAALLTRCSNRGEVSVTAQAGGKAGGIAGSCGAVRLSDCLNAGAVTVSGSGTLASGGLLGSCGSSAVQISDAYNVGRVSMTGIGSSGGLVGESGGELRITNAYQAGSVRTTAIVGLARGRTTLTNVYKVGTQADAGGSRSMLTGSAVRMSADELRNAAEGLGDHFVSDSLLTNSGYPLLSWQVSAPAGAASGTTAAANEAAAEAITANAAADGAVLPVENEAQMVKAAEYLKQNGETILLITYIGGLSEGSIPCYDAAPMLWSGQYQAYVCLTTDAAAEITDEKVTMADAIAESLAYTGDVNGSGAVDINDAQLLYTIYNAQIDVSQLDQKQLLEADVNGDGVVDTGDAAYLTEHLMSA